MKTKRTLPSSHVCLERAKKLSHLSFIIYTLSLFTEVTRSIYLLSKNYYIETKFKNKDIDNEIKILKNWHNIDNLFHNTSRGVCDKSV